MGELPTPYGEERATPEQIEEINTLYAFINYSQCQTPMSPDNPNASIRVWNGVDERGGIHTTSLEFVPCTDVDGGTLSALGVVRRVNTRILEMYLCDTAQVLCWRGNNDVRRGYEVAERMIHRMGGILDALQTRPDLVEIDGRMGPAR